MVNLFRKQSKSIQKDVLSGLTVSLALVPEAVAFAFVAGVDPLVGLYGAFIMGIITSIFGGRPGMISGATGAMAIVMVGLIQHGNMYGQGLAEPIQNLGLQWLFITLLIVGAIQITAGIAKVGKFVRLIPHSVMMGFVNGLAIVIFLSQLGMFKEFALDNLGQKILMENGTFMKQFISGNALLIMVGLVALTMGIMYGLPKLTKKIPAALTAIIVVAGIVIFSGMDVSTVGSFVREGAQNPDAGIAGGLPTLQIQLLDVFPSLNWEAMKHILPTAVLLAAVGLIESLMTLNLIDEITDTRGSGNKECIAQGAANMANGLFGGMGGCAMIGQSIINVNAGGRGRLSGIIAALALLCFILFGSELIEQIPIAALIGVMFMVVIGTFAWSSFRILNKIPFSDAFVLILVSGLTVMFDLAIAVIAGVIVSALVFSWENAKRIRARKHINEKGVKIYEIWGPLFFGSIHAFNQKFDVVNDPDRIEIDFMESKVSDHSGIEALRGIVNKYEDAGKTVTLKHLSADCTKLLIKRNIKFEEIIQTNIDDPRYHVVSDTAGIME
ncbi:SulP family inorganic anion transporter [Flavobacteriales bacterium]|nr:SulP family inorganic anion transporter [Flavobacteriales bacterium]